MFLYFGIAIQPLFFQALGFSLADVLWLESILLVSAIIFEVPTGIIGDILGRKTSLILGNIVILLSWIPWLLGSSFVEFAVAHALIGLGLAFSSGSDQALIYDDLKQAGRTGDMQRIMGMYGAWPLVGTAIASVVAGVLASTQSLGEYYQLFLLTASAQVIALVILSTVKESPQRISRRQLPGLERAVRNFAEGFRLLRNNGELRRLVLLSAFTMPFSVLLYRLAPPYFQSLNTPANWLGIAVAVATLAALAAKLIAHKLDQRFGVTRTTLVVTMLPALAWIGLAFTATPGLAILVFILNDAAGNLRDPVFADYMNRHIPSENRATTLSIIALFVSVYAAVMRPLLATVGDYDLRTAFIATGTILFVGALLFRVTEANTRPQTAGRAVD